LLQLEHGGLVRERWGALADGAGQQVRLHVLHAIIGIARRNRITVDWLAYQVRPLAVCIKAVELTGIVPYCIATGAVACEPLQGHELGSADVCGLVDVLFQAIDGEILAGADVFDCSASQSSIFELPNAVAGARVLQLCNLLKYTDNIVGDRICLECKDVAGFGQQRQRGSPFFSLCELQKSRVHDGVVAWPC
jgi:hypothetical protein